MSSFELYPIIKDASVYIQSYFSDGSEVDGSGFIVYLYRQYWIVTTSLNVINDNDLIANKIFVSIQNVNRSEFSLIYQADIVGLFNQGFIALLKISDNEWNKSLPELKTQSYLSFGQSIGYPVGQRAYVLGSLYGGDHQTLISTTIANNNFCATLTPVEFDFPEFNSTLPQIFLSCILPSKNSRLSGGPILSDCGRVIGMIITKTLSLKGNPVDTAIGIGPSQSFIQAVVQTFILGINSPYGKHLIVSDEGFYNFVFGRLGVGIVSYTAKTLATNQIDFKEWTGAVVSFVSNPDSPLKPYVDAGDTVLITKEADVSIGVVPPEVSIGSTLFRYIPGDVIKVEFRLLSEKFSVLHIVDYILI